MISTRGRQIVKGLGYEKSFSQLKQQEGPDLHVYGSAHLVQTLMKHDLIDEFWLKIYPLTLGSGSNLNKVTTII